MEHNTSAPNERVSRITQLAKLSFNHLSVVLTAVVFQFFIKFADGFVSFFVVIRRENTRTWYLIYEVRLTYGKRVTSEGLLRNLPNIFTPRIT